MVTSFRLQLRTSVHVSSSSFAAQEIYTPSIIIVLQMEHHHLIAEGKLRLQVRRVLKVNQCQEVEVRLEWVVPVFVAGFLSGHQTVPKS